MKLTAKVIKEQNPDRPCVGIWFYNPVATPDAIVTVSSLYNPRDRDRLAQAVAGALDGRVVAGADDDPLPMQVAGEPYDRAASEALRAEVIAVRDEALLQSDFEWAVKLSHVVAWMAAAIEERWGYR